MKKLTDETILKLVTTDLDTFGAYLVSGSVHGKPGLPTAELDRIEKVLSKNLSPEQQFSLAKKLSQRPEYVARSLSCVFLHHGWQNKSARQDVEKLMRILANDEDWIVREWSAGLFGRLLGADFDYFRQTFSGWLKSESTNVKRAIALAIKYDSRRKDPSTIKTYLHLLEPLMSETDEYIRKNLGPFAIGDAVLPRFPKETLSALKKWSRSKNENVCWNVAMTFSAAQAVPFASEGIALLEHLATDERRFFWRAVCSAMRVLAKREPLLFKRTVKEWAKDPAKSAAVETLKKIK